MVHRLSIAACIGCLVLLAAACSRAAKHPTPTGAAQTVLRLSTSRIDNLNPLLSGGGATAYLSFLWGAYLYLADPENRLHPELATTIPTRANGGISPDGLTLTYHLRRGVRWQDGAPFGARDVIFTWHAIMNPHNNVVSRLGYDKVASMTALDPWTVQVRLRERYAPIVATLFAPGAVPMPILPAHLLTGLPDINHAAYNRLPIGTGPFRVVAYDPGSKVILRANPLYWRGRPRLASIQYLVVPDENTVEVMLRSGELDAGLVYGEHAVELEHASGIRIVRQTANQNEYLAFNVRRPPLDDVRVRDAISQSLDRGFFVRAFEDGNGSVDASDQPPFSVWYDPHVRPVRYDPVAAARLLDAAGWRLGPDGYRSREGRRLQITLATIAGRDPDTKFGPYFQHVMRTLGIAVEVRPYPYNLFYAEKSSGGILMNGRYDAALTGWVGGVDPDDASLWMCDQWPPNGYNVSFLCDPRIDAQERIALTSYDPDRRRRAYWRIQELLAQDAPVAFLSWVDLTYAVSRRVRNFAPGEFMWDAWDWCKE